MNLLVIDGSHTIFRSIFASMNNKNVQFNYKFAVYVFIKSILKELKDYNAFPIVCFDKGGSKYRNELMEGQYKANRQREEVDIVLDSVKADYQFGMYEGQEVKNLPIEILTQLYNDLSNKVVQYHNGDVEYLTILNEEIKNTLPYKTYIYGVDLVKEHFANLGIPVIQEYGIEADDFAYFISNYSKHPGRLLSEDWDWVLALSPNFDLKKPIKDELITYAQVSEWHNNLVGKIDSPVTVERMIKAVTGDAGDNIPGFSGIGLKTACKLVDELVSVGLNNILEMTSESITEKLGDRLKYQKTFIENIDQVKTNYKLVGFDHIDKDKEIMKSVLEESMKNLKSPSQINYISMCNKLDSETLINDYRIIKDIPKVTEVSEFINF